MKLWCVLLAALSCSAADLPISGIAHVALRVDDIEASRGYYARMFGREEPFEFRDQGKTSVAFLKLNDQHYIELYPGFRSGQSRIAHVCFETPDLAAVVRRLSAAGLNPTQPNRARAGNLLSVVRDPEQNVVEFLQYLPGSLHRNTGGKALGQDRRAAGIRYVALTAGDVNRTAAFYEQKLGFSLQRTGAELRIHVAGARGEWLQLREPGAVARIGLDPASGAASRVNIDPNGIEIELERR